MSVVAQVRIAAEALRFEDAFRTDAETEVEILRLVSDDATVVPYLWIEAAEPDRFEAGLRADSRITDLTRHDDRAGKTLYHAEWTTTPDGFLALVGDHGVSVERGVRADDDWAFRLRVPDRDSLREFRVDCRERDLPLRTDWVADGASPPASDERPSAVARSSTDEARGRGDKSASAVPQEHDRRSTDASEHAGPFRDIVENLNEVVWMTDSDKAEILYVNPAYEAVWGRSRERLFEEPLAFLDAVHPEDRGRVRDALDAQASGDYDEVYRIVRPDGSHRWIHDRSVPIRDATGEVYRLVGIAEDVTQQKKREHALKAINEVTRDLLTVQSRNRIADLVVRTVNDSLDLPLVSVYRFDTDAGVLRPAAWSSDVDDVLGDPPTFTGTGSLAWNAFVHGDTRAYDDVRTHDKVYDSETPIRSELIVPIGDYGVILAGDCSTDAFDDTDVEFAELLASNATVALDRIAHERELERQNARLMELSRLNTVIRSINRAIVTATTRDRIVSDVCEQLVESGPYPFAWIGEYRTDERITIHAASGFEETAVDRRIPVGGAPVLDELVGTAIRTRAVHVIPDLQATPAADGWHERIVDRGGRSVAAIPLTAGEASYGVLTLYTDRPDGFDEEDITVLRELGQTIGRAIRAAEIRRALTTETALELEFRTADGGSWFVATSDALDCRFDLDGVVTLDDGTVLVYARSTDGDPGALADRADESSTVDLHRVIGEGDDDHLYEFRISGASPIRTLLDYGATIQSAVVDRGTARIGVEMTPETEVRTVLNGLRDVCPDTELIGKRELDRSVETIQQFHETLTERLTEKQLNTLRTAYFTGYFEWPRRSTAEEIASSMEISSATLHFHLRRALNKMLVATFERDCDT